jgi:hypothetical protein
MRAQILVGLVLIAGLLLPTRGNAEETSASRPQYSGIYPEITSTGGCFSGPHAQHSYRLPMVYKIFHQSWRAPAEDYPSDHFSSFPPSYWHLNFCRPYAYPVELYTVPYQR